MLKKILKKTESYVELMGISPRKLIRTIRGIPYFISDFKVIKKEIKRNSSEFKISSFYPCLEDRFDKSGVGKGHYFNQDLYVAQKIFNKNPVRHVDIGSRIDGFVAHVASFREIEVFDIRPLENLITNIKFTQADFMSDNFNFTDYCDSVSSLHVIEHFGLGRYGDPITVNGHIKGLNNIHQMLKKGGRFYFSVPIGPQRIEFNAHRVFDLRYLLDLIEPRYRIVSFSHVGNDNLLHINSELSEENIKNNFNCSFGCGIFELEKL